MSGAPRFWPWLALLAAAACSGGAGERSAPGERSVPSPERPAEAAASSPESKLRAAQETALEALCERLVDCSVESARANMNPDELARLDVENTAPRLRDQCEEEGGQTSWSPRQVRVVQRCVNDARTCEALETCLEEAKKRPE